MAEKIWDEHVFSAGEKLKLSVFFSNSRDFIRIIRIIHGYADIHDHIRLFRGSFLNEDFVPWSFSPCFKIRCW